MPLPPAVNTIGLPFVELQSVDSTNKYAMGLVHAGMAQHGMAVFVQEQTAGRGQRARSWSSEQGSNIILSIVINPYPIRISEAFRLNAAVAVALHHFFEKYAGKETKIKWPNDLYWRDRKAGGVLIENIVRGPGTEAGSVELTEASHKSSGWPWAVIGIGININQTVFATDLPNPVSLKQITGKDFTPVDLAKELCTILDIHLKILHSGNADSIFNSYQEILYKRNENVKLKKGTRVFETTIRGVSPLGQLITHHAVEERFEFGEVEWII